MTIQQLQAFVAVCETNNFAKAAKNLNMYPSNLSYTITEFENSLDVLLLNCSKKGVYPNILGQEVYSHAKKILDLVYLPLNHEINQRKVYAVYPDDVENPEMIETALNFVCKQIIFVFITKKMIAFYFHVTQSSF